MKGIIAVSFALTLIFTLGCRSGTSIIVDHSDSVPFKIPQEVASIPHNPVKPDDIEVVDMSSLSRQFVIVGLAEAETSSLVQAVPLLRTEASKIGGDAILDILPSPGGNQTLGVPVVGDLSFRSGKVWTARIIRWIPANSPLKNASLPK